MENSISISITLMKHDKRHNGKQSSLFGKDIESLKIAGDVVYVHIMEYYLAKTNLMEILSISISISNNWIKYLH